MMKLMVFCPYTDFSRYGLALQSMLSNQHWTDPLEIVLMKGGEPVPGVHTQEAISKNVSAKYRHGQDLFLAGDYDAFVCWEQDTLVPPDALWRLAHADADIVYGLYCMRHGTPAWSFASVLDSAHFESVWKVSPRQIKRQMGQVIPVKGIGQGLTLIRRHVLEKIEFRALERGGSWFCSDWMLAEDAQNAGFSQVGDLGVICGHIDPPHIIWPDPSVSTGYRLEPLESTASRTEV